MRTLLISIFCVRFVMVGMEVIVPLVTSRMRDAQAKANSRAESTDKVIWPNPFKGRYIFQHRHKTKYPSDAVKMTAIND